jgi:hypothetical protein
MNPVVKDEEEKQENLRENLNADIQEENKI